MKDETAWTGLKWLVPNGVLCALKHQLLLPVCARMSLSCFLQSQKLWGTYPVTSGAGLQC